MQSIHRYDSTTGTFTVPPGGDGFYYFSTYLLVVGGEWGDFEIQINGEMLCSTLFEVSMKCFPSSFHVQNALVIQSST